MRKPLVRRVAVDLLHNVSWHTGLSRSLAHRGRGARVLLLHEVGTPEYPAEEFRKHLQYLRKRYAMVRLEHLLQAVETGAPDTARMVAVTFDDGLRCSTHTALPILTELGIPATFFVCPALIERGEWIWTHDCRERLRSLPEAERRALLPVDRTGAASPDAIVEWLKSQPESIRATIHGAIREHTNSFRASDRQHAEFDPVRWDDLRGLPSSLFEIGSHGTEHRALPQVDDTTLREEVHESRIWLERELGRPIDAFAYPNGRVDDHVVARVRESYRNAVTAEPAFVLPSGDRHRIPRIGVPRKLKTLAWRLHSPGWAGGHG